MPTLTPPVRELLPHKLYRFLGYLKHLQEDGTITYGFKPIWIPRESIDDDILPQGSRGTIFECRGGFRVDAWLEANFAPGESSDFTFPDTRKRTVAQTRAIGDGRIRTHFSGFSMAKKVIRGKKIFNSNGIGRFWEGLRGGQVSTHGRSQIMERQRRFLNEDAIS
jgi:hypothetical protein